MFLTGEPEAHGRARRRVLWGLAIANAGPAGYLAFLWWFLPEAYCPWGILSGAIAGISAAAFPQFLHGALASEKRWRKHYTEAQWDGKDGVLDRWDPVWHRSHPLQQLGVPGSDRSENSLRAHLIPGFVQLVLYPAIAWLVTYFTGTGLGHCA